jgi:Tfp pilus assembly protein PilF
MNARSPWLGALGLVLLAVAAHSPSLRAGFLWDDEFWLWKSPLTLAGDGIVRAWFSADRWDFYPITSSAFWILWRSFGENAAGYHAVNVGLHAVGAALVWRVLVALGVPGAWVAAALFAVHPVTVGSVAWITQLKNTLSLVFSAATMFAWLRFDAADGRDRRRWWILALAAFVAALLSKASAVMLPVALLAASAWRRRGWAAADARAALPFFVLSVAQSITTVWFQTHRVFGGEEAAAESLALRIAAAGSAIWFYAGKAIAPLDLSIIYPRTSPDPATLLAWLPLVALIATFAAAVATCGGFGRPILFAGTVFVVMLIPVLGLVEMYYLRYSRVADHWQYLALPAMLALFVGAATNGLRRLGPPAVAIALAALAIVGAGALSVRQAAAYRDAGTLWRTVLARNPEAWVAHNGLGTWLGAHGDHPGAIEHFERSYRAALAVRADYADARADLGRLLAQQGRIPDAIAELRTAVQAQPLHGEARYNLALALAQTGDTEAAVEELRAAVEHAPEHVAARYVLAKLLVRAGDLAGAAEQLREVVRRQPDYEDAAGALEAVNSALDSAG